MPLPPLLADRPPALRFALTFVTPAVAGLVAGLTLGLSVAAWMIANVLATLGGFEHDTLAGAARRGAIGGLLFGSCLALADATVVGDRVATIVEPTVLHPLVTTIAGTLLSVAGAALRGRIARRREAAAAVAVAVG
jgi:hypothetical protein